MHNAGTGIIKKQSFPTKQKTTINTTLIKIIHKNKNSLQQPLGSSINFSEKFIAGIDGFKFSPSSFLNSLIML